MNDNLTPVTVTEADLKRFAPRAKREYLTAILGNLSHLRSAGVLESELRWCHFMAQCGHETDGFTIIRESLHYKSVARIREVWPARFKSWSDERMAPLVGNPVALGDAVYGGRMGNRATVDGCAYRGGGPLQTTGAAAVAEYAGRLGLDPVPALLDDVNITLQFACLEWQAAGCSEHADENDIVKVSKAINTGSATGGVAPVGLDGRREWFAKAWGIWGDKGKADKPAKKPMSIRDTLVKVGAPVVAAGELVRQGVPAVPEVATKSLEHAGAWKKIGQGFWGVGAELASLPWKILAVAGVAGVGALAYRLWSARDEKAD